MHALAMPKNIHLRLATLSTVGLPLAGRPSRLSCSLRALRVLSASKIISPVFSVFASFCVFCGQPVRIRSFAALPLFAALCALLVATLAPPALAATTAKLPSDAGRLIIETPPAPPPATVYFSASADQQVTVGQAEIVGEIRLKLHLVQGLPDTLTLGLSGDGDILSVTGPRLLDWSVRQGASSGPTSGQRFLDLRPALTPVPLPRTTSTPLPSTASTSPLVPRSPLAASTDLELVVVTRLRKPTVPGQIAVPLLTAGNAVSFLSKVTVRPDANLDVRALSTPGLTPLTTGGNAAASARDTQYFLSNADARLELQLTPRAGAPADAELLAAQLSGQLNPTSSSADFRLRAQLRARKPNARLRLLSGRAAFADQTSGDGWHIELVPLSASPDPSPDQPYTYDLVSDREGTFPLDLSFTAEIRETGDWRSLDFAMPAGAVVPLLLTGLDPHLSFKPDSPVVPTSTPQGWQGFLPADGTVSLAWKNQRAASEGALFFTSFEQSEVRLGAGLLRQSSQISFRILQGKLGAARLRLEGPGEITGVEGTHVVGWKVIAAAAPTPPTADLTTTATNTAHPTRTLEISFSRPVETEGRLVITSQTELGNGPVRADPIRLTPEGGVRHSGFVRIANQGAVRLEVADATGLMQLAPAQWPGAAAETGARQIFVYRFPSATRSYRILASQIQPEVGVSVLSTYELAETARVLTAAIELDVREAPLRDWTLLIPADHTVVALTGADVADHTAESTSDPTTHTRALRIFFSRAVEGRQLLQLRLEKNQPAAAGDWHLPALQFPGAKSVRGHVGAVATPGYRLVPARTDRLVEVPLAFFPQQTAGLQQAWRIRETDWTADLRVEALGQSVQADVFHLYSLKPGAVVSSVLLNYFVVGAPATEWRIEVPPEVGNIDVTGQNVRRDWRREGNQLIVSLHQPVLGSATLLVTFEQPMSARGGMIAPGQIRPLGVQAERGFIQVVSPLQVKSEIRRAEGGLLKLEPTELPAEFRLLTSAPSLAVYHYTARPFALEMSVDWYAPGETVDQVVDFAQLSSRVARDGQVVTEARFFVKTRGQKSLRLILPENAKLWEARVDNQLVNARADAGHTIVPLPARPNPNEPVAVTLRLAQPAVGSGTAVTLVAPRSASAPIVINEWTVRSDSGRQLVPRSGNVELLSPALTENGFEWITSRGALGTTVLLMTLALASLFLRAETGWKIPAGLLACAVSLTVALILCSSAFLHRNASLGELTFASTMVPVGETVSLHFANVPAWRAVLVGWGLATAAAGVALLLANLISALREHRSAPFRNLAGVVLLALGLLAQHGGAVAFFAATALAVVTRLFLPAISRWQENRRAEGATPYPSSGPSGAATVSLLALVCLVGLTVRTAPSLLAAPPTHPSLSSLSTPTATPLLDGTKPAQSSLQTWSIRGDRLFAELAFTARGAVGDSFLLLQAPAVLTEFKGDGLRVAKVERDGQTAYYVAAERAGLVTARVRYELPVPDRTPALALPTGPAATQRVTLELDQAGWEFASPMAVSISPTAGLGENRSGATLVLAPHRAPVIQLRPQRRAIATEATVFFAEATHLFVPGPGVVNGFSRVTIRPAQGRVSALELDVPPGLTVGEVSRGPVGAWRFDPSQRRLHVAVEPAQTQPFSFIVETQLGAGELPFSLALAPLRTLGAAGDVGLLALAFGGDAQPESIRATDLSAVNAQDFDAALLPRTREGQPLAAVQQVWRYGPTDGRVELKIAPVAPEVRVSSRQVLSLDDDRMVMAVDLRVAITRVGLFKLSFPLPDGLEVEALSGPALSHWTDTSEGPQRIVTLHLNGRTLGEQTFNLSLAGAAPRAQAAWPFPRLLVREATRQTADALVVPGKGLRLRAVDREKVTQLDPRSLGGQQLGSLAFRFLQEDWVLHLGIEALEPWVTVAALQEVTLREGQTLTRLALRYRVENAAVKHVQLKLPGLGDERARTVRATGSAVSEIVRVADTPDLWEIRFQRGIAGETDVQIEFQGLAASERGQESVAPPEFVGTRQTAQFVAIRSGGRLELDAGPLPRGWTKIDWSAVPANLQSRTDRTVPALCFRVAEPEATLVVNVRRHAVAEALKLRVTQGELTTLFAPTGACLTAVELKVDVLEKSTLRVRLPQGARLFNTFVNGESVSAVREDDAYLFYVSPNTAADRSAAVRLVYAVSETAGRASAVALVGPSLSVPLENVTWRVVIPPGYDLDRYTGALRLREESSARSFGVDDYRSLVSSKRSADAQQAMSFLQQANTWAQSGDQEKASEAFSRISNNLSLDAASNEDARVQLRNLKTQQTVLGLNTRRQRLYLDNRADSTRNASLEQAANLNPFMQGKVNFNPQQVDQLLMGNTAEENTALRGIATRIVDQQLDAEPPPGALDVTLSERGRVFTFTRSLQVDGGAPLELTLAIAKTTRTSLPAAFFLILTVAALAAVELSRRSPRRA